MQNITAVVESFSDTGLFVGNVPRSSGVYSLGETLDDPNENLHELAEMLFEDRDPSQKDN